ncbi:DUF3576 domain-containing protein [Alphaproteobacteria bacterium]|nr:DUF3576 domain-containing protein [Alphaproteobacteria bacterium]
MKISITFLIFLLLISCSSDYEVPTEKSEPGLFSKDRKKGMSITDFLNKDPYEDKSFYVNSFLWRASLDVLSFAPFQSTDAFGGILVTEWYKKNDEQIKLIATVKSRELRSEGIKLQVFIKNKKNEITEDIVLAKKIENLILTKARRLRIQNKLN